ncbi:MAG: hypothetical protein IJ736_06520 [Firmicutes bacterium]|nr:hypothetical protein [Bacillota bacterium]
MNKRIISKMKRPESIKKAQRKLCEKLVMTAQSKIIDHHKIFVINIFTDRDFSYEEYTNRKLNVYEPFLRIFFYKNEYITQDLRMKKTKWYIGKIDNIFEYFSFYISDKKDNIYASEDTIHKVAAYLKIEDSKLRSGNELYSAIN